MRPATAGWWLPQQQQQQQQWQPSRQIYLLPVARLSRHVTHLKGGQAQKTRAPGVSARHSGNSPRVALAIKPETMLFSCALVALLESRPGLCAVCVCCSSFWEESVRSAHVGDVSLRGIGATAERTMTEEVACRIGHPLRRSLEEPAKRARQEPTRRRRRRSRLFFRKSKRTGKWERWMAK